MRGLLIITLLAMPLIFLLSCSTVPDARTDTSAFLDYETVIESEMTTTTAYYDPGSEYYYSIDEFEDAAKNGVLGGKIGSFDKGGLDNYYYPKNMIDGAVFYNVSLRYDTYIAISFKLKNINNDSDNSGEGQILSWEDEFAEEVVYTIYSFPDGVAALEETIKNNYKIYHFTEGNAIFEDGYFEDYYTEIPAESTPYAPVYVSKIRSERTNDLILCYEFYYTVDNTMVCVRIPAQITTGDYTETLKYLELEKIDIK